MTTDLPLARRAVACAAWRWLPGMRVLPGEPTPPARCVRANVFAVEQQIEMAPALDNDRTPILQRGKIPFAAGPVVEAWSDDALTDEDAPDLTDPATIGCMLVLVREAWRCPTAYVRQSSVRRAIDGVLAWEVCGLWFDAGHAANAGVRAGAANMWGLASEAEALVVALESAP